MNALELMRSIGTVADTKAAAAMGSTPARRPKLNSHIHLPPNFSAFTTIAQAIDLARQQEVAVVGVTNYYDYRVYDQFAELAQQNGIFPMFGLEIITLVDELVKSGMKINDPGNPGRLYICGKGTMRFGPVPPAAMEVLTKIRKSDVTRMAGMVAKMGDVFAKQGLNLGVSEASVKQMIVDRHGCGIDQVYVQERHIAQAFQEAIFARLPADKRADALAKAYGVAPKAPVDDAVKTQNEIRSNLLRAGKPAFVVESFVSYPEARKMILGMGGIPCYPTLADGASPLCGYEDPIETLIANIKGLGVPMAEFIPVRNTPEVLTRYVKAMRAAGLAVVGGTEHNTLDLIPIEPTCLKGVAVPDEVKDIFWEGACVVAAHQFLVAHGEAGFVDESGQPNPAYSTDDQRIKAFARLGAAVIARYLRLAQWPVFSAGDAPIDQLVKLSHYYGADSEMVIAGGGNTSVKVGDRLWVKGSGYSLATIPADGFVELDRTKLQSILDSQFPADRTVREEAFKTAVMAARVYPEKCQRPSVEAVLHHAMPCKFVVHSHATLVNMFTCCVNGETLIREALGDAVVWIGGVDPGHPLARALGDALKVFKVKTGQECPRAVIMQNHGLVVCGNTPEQVKADTNWVLSKLQAVLAGLPAGEPYGPRQAHDFAEARKQINVIAPALRAVLASGDTLKVVTFDDSDTVLSLVGGAAGAQIVSNGPLSPDQIVYAKSFPMWFDAQPGEDAPSTVKRLKAAVEAHVAKSGAGPLVVLVKGVGMFCVGDDYAAANTVRLVYTDAIKVMAGACRLGGVLHLTSDYREFIENWEVESYRKSVSANARPRGRAAGRIAIVTGAAQGFGMEISRHFASEGGHVVLTDMNADGAKNAAAGICSERGEGRAMGLPVNVTNAASLEDMIHQVVRQYGGFDTFISNAGVLKAASVKVQSEKDFDFVTNVNYKGFFLCTQKAAGVLAVQRLAKSDYFSDIIQINSKSGLQGSNKNGAYAGSKFGGIGLVQSFAMELVTDGVKVNAICPGNFFDGPLWSDPNTGLFVQYLTTGKVPGAKSIADVKKFYETKVPMGRGCTTPDVMKAVYYLIDQKYETGQAVPVTGGQVMLK